MKIIPFLLLIAACGCASVGRQIDMSKVDLIAKGVSTKADVIALIGSPDTIASDSDGITTMVYVYSRATTKGETFIPIYGAFAGGMNVQTQSVTVLIGSDGKVTKVTQSQSAMDTRTGANTAPRAEAGDVEINKRPN